MMALSLDSRRRILGVLLWIVFVGGLALLPRATSRPALAQTPLEPHAPTEMQTITDSSDPTSITVDKDGCTVWTYEYPDTWCVMYSRIRWPFDLGAQDPSDLSETSFILTFSEQQYVVGPGGEPRYTDPTWAVALNAKPGPWVDGSFTGDWNVIGAISTEPTWAYKVPIEQEIPFDYSQLIDGENNLWFQQQDFCHCEALPDCACTCYELNKLQLRAMVKLGVKSVSPEPDALNVSVDQHKNSEIKVSFTTLVSPTTVNKETFQLFYYDPELNRVPVDGDVRQLSSTEFAFVPTQALKDGIRYEVQVWDEDEARSHGRDRWVTDLSGGPLENGQIWSFWTLPQIEVKLVPVQVVEGATSFIANKPTVLRTFIRWDAKPDVFELDQVAELEVHDIVLSWLALDGNQQGQVHWNGDDYGWRPARDPSTARRKREYREFSTPRDSYDKFDKQVGRDSVNYFGFMPLETGNYLLSAQVWVRDNQGQIQKLPQIPALASFQVIATRRFGLHMRAVAVGSDFGKTGTIDLSDSVQDSVDTVKAIYPVPSVSRPSAPSAMPYYKPTTTLWIFHWAVEPAWSFPKKYLLQELSALCAKTTGCDAMIGFVPPAWLVDAGLTLPEAAPQGALVQRDTTGFYRFLAAHEIGHLYGFEHDTLTGGEGYEVSRRQDKRYSVSQLPPQTQKTLNAIYNFMTIDPIESPPPERLWIDDTPYNLLLSRLSGGQVMASSQITTSDALLLASGAITETSGEVGLLPWYQLDPGEWTPPTPGPYQLVFLDAAGQEIAGYSQPFSVTATLQPAALDPALQPAADEPAFFTLKVPYPATTARVQLIRTADQAVLAEVVPAAEPPSLSLDPPGGAPWQGPQTLTWQSETSPTHYFAVDVSTDGGATWQALAINLTDPNYTLETAGLPDTDQALVRVSASDGLRTTTVTTGPFSIDNPPLVAYVSPLPGETGVSVDQPIVIGFRDAMDPATLHAGTFGLSAGVSGTLSLPGGVSGTLGYDAGTRQATFTPKVPLAYSTTYTAQITGEVRDAAGEALPAGYTWRFSTEADLFPPRPRAFSPDNDARNVPLGAQIAVLWDQPLDPGSLASATFQLASASGDLVSGTLSYDSASLTSVYSPSSALVTNTRYVATLKAGVQDADGNATLGDTSWSFSTGRKVSDALALTGAYADYGLDGDGDSRYEQLRIQVGVQVTTTGSYVLRGSLADSEGGEITWAYTETVLPAGAHFVELAFDGAAIGGHGVDGPYTLTDLTLTRIDGAQVLAFTSQREAYHTFAYAAARFPAPLVFAGLPDVVVIPGTSFLNPFNVRDYADHASLPSDQLSYTLMLNTQPAVSVTLQPAGEVYIRPKPYWEGRTQVTIRASDGVHAAQDSFEVLVGWPQSVYLPVIFRNSDGAGLVESRDAWITQFTDDFESETIGWHRSSWTYKEGDPPPGGFGWYQWGVSDCRAYAGEQSAWAYGGGDDGELLECGAAYPDTYSLGTMLNQTVPVNLKYAAKGEYSARVWTNLAPDDKVCLHVALLESGFCDNGTWPVGEYHGVCRSGATDGWEELTLDLSDVPTLGNVLGQERVCVAVVFEAYEPDSRPEGAYVDDVTMHLCPEGLTDLCVGSAGVAPPTSTLLVPANIGGYPEAVSEMALAVEANGRVHALWTGKLNPNFETYVFYSSSTDGLNWAPYQILNYWGGREPRIAVDVVHGRVHLAYANADGIVHRTVEDGVVSAPTVVVAPRTYYLPGLSLPSGGVAWPSLAVAEESGYAYLVWREAYFVDLVQYYSLRYRTWHAYWDGDAWSAPLRKINDQDTQYASVAAAPDGQAMMAWFQRWEQSSGGGVGPGDPIVARTAYGTEPGSFPLRQATHDLYPVPERDESILLAYSGGNDAFVLASSHAMWPGHSRAYRYLWQDGDWTGPLDVAENLTGFATPVYVGAAADASLIRYVYWDNTGVQMRTETDGLLSPPQRLNDYLAARGYTDTGAPLAYFTDATGNLHLAVSGEKDGVAGFYYVEP